MMSAYGVVYYRREGYLPGASRAQNVTSGDAIDPDKEAFSTAPHGGEYENLHQDEEQHDQHAGGYHGEPSGGYNGEPSHAAPSYEEPSAYSGAYQPPRVYEEDSAYSGYGNAQDPFTDTHGAAQFPHARYDNI